MGISLIDGVEVCGVSEVGIVEFFEDILAGTSQDRLAQRFVSVILGHGELRSTFLLIYFGLGIVISWRITALFVGSVFLFGDTLIALDLGLLLLD